MDKRPPGPTPPRRPKWVTVLVIVAVVVVGVIVVMALGGGGHGPGRHPSGGDDSGGRTLPVEAQRLIR